MPRSASTSARARGYAAWGLEYGAFAGVGLDGRQLERAVGGAPTLLILLDGHTGLATPRALELAGVRGPVALDGSAEVVVRDGVPTGELREPAALALVRAAIPPLDPRAERELFAQIQQRFAQVGLTGAHVMDGTPATLDLLRELEGEDRLAVRHLLALLQEPETTFEAMKRDAALGAEHGRLWRVGAAKFFIDGVLDTGTSWLEEPDLQGDGLQQLWPDHARYERAVKLFADAGVQCVTHATGDRAVRAALDAYRAAGRSGVGTHRIEHVELLRDRELPRFAAEGVAASMQPLHMQWLRADMSDSISSRLGAMQLARGWRTGDLQRSGALMPLGSDWPVATFDPRVGMAWARLRRTPGDAAAHVFGPEQVLDGLRALMGYTTAAARVAGEQDVAGRIAPGCRADLSGFAEDPVACSADALPDLPVTLTVVDGRLRHRD